MCDITQKAKPVVNGDHDDVILGEYMGDIDVSASGAIGPSMDVGHDST